MREQPDRVVRVEFHEARDLSMQAVVYAATVSIRFDRTPPCRVVVEVGVYLDIEILLEAQRLSKKT